MIGDTLKASGRRSIEIKQRVYFPRHSGVKAFQLENYHIETWFFFPSSLQINRWNYPPQALQQNLKNYLRLRPQTVMLRKFAINCPKLLAEIMRLITLHDSDTPLQSGYEYQLKKFCLTFKRAMHLEARYLKKLSGEKQDRVLMHFTTTSADILRDFRQMREKMVLKAEPNALRVVDYCDEYLSVTFSQYGREILNSFPDSPAREELRAFWREQMQYRKANHPATFPTPNADNELVIYRLNTLKKYINSPMYLDIRRKNGETLLAHTIAGLAAALAMIFATAVAFVWQGKYGALSFQLFVAMVIGYIFKDRMKESFKLRLFSRFRRWLPDRRQFIFKNLRQLVGVCDESFVFTEESKLPEDVRAMRRKVHVLDIQNYYLSEDILHYSKHVQLRNAGNLFAGFNRSVMDITRLDITPFLKHTDELLDQLTSLEEEHVIYGDKVYHINMIRRVTDGKESILERARIVINSEGIKRIEPVFMVEDDGDRDGE